MCLYATYGGTEKLYKKLQKTGSITCYKVLRRNLNGRYYSPIYYTKPWKVGVRKGYKSPYRVYEPGTQLLDEYGHGIHVHITKTAAEVYGRNCYDPQYTIVPVKCDAKDFIAANSNAALFRKVTVEKLP